MRMQTVARFHAPRLGVSRQLRSNVATPWTRHWGRGLHGSTEDGELKPLQSILVANRGEIALRVARTASQMGIKVASLYTTPDRHSQHALASQHAYSLGDNTTGYLDGNKIIDIAKREGYDAVHPGYGFLSENAEFARSCTEAGITFIGPPSSAIEEMGDKARSKEIMNAAGVPCVPGYHGPNQDPEFLASQASEIGYPVLIKAVKGGGGKGMRIAQSEADFESQLASARSEASSAFGRENDAVLVERYITAPRHVEVQVFADAHGNVVALGERDCSVQRRHQKILEESPAPGLALNLRKDLWNKARAAARAVGYRGAGTVEFILDNATGEFFFMEMNTRLQVEHPVTEMVTGLDLVEWQVKVARGEPLPVTQDQVEQRLLGYEAGHAIEARIYAEIPEKGFVPDSGTLVHYVLPPRDSRVRVDAGFGEGDTVSAHYDPMIAKLITHGANRTDALAKLLRALESYEIAGVGTNIEFLKSVVRHPEFARGQVETAFIEKNEKSLFVEMDTPTEVLVQTALACFLKERKQSMDLEFADIWKGDNGVGFSPSAAYQSRSFEFASGSMNDNGKPSGRLMVITICEQKKNVFTVTLNHGSNVMKDLAVQMQVLDKPGASICKVQTFFPESRLDTTIVFPKDVSPEMGAGPITAFQHGHKFTLHASPPEWLRKLLSQRAASTPKSSVRAPMPCKILRVEVEPGQHVKANEPLVVIESMKMETVIRAPGPGAKIVKRVVHKVGDMCKAGTALVEFEGETDETA